MRSNLGALHAPATPYQRLISDARISQEIRECLHKISSQLDPVVLLHNIRTVQQRLVEIADKVTETDAPANIEIFLQGLRHAWSNGEVRPTAKLKPRSKRERRHPDPLVTVTCELQGWFEAEPWHTSRELLDRLQQEYPDHLLRTLQRRVKEWRRSKAHMLVFGSSSAEIESKSKDIEPPVSANSEEHLAEATEICFGNVLT